MRKNSLRSSEFQRELELDGEYQKKKRKKKTSMKPQKKKKKKDIHETTI